MKNIIRTVVLLLATMFNNSYGNNIQTEIILFNTAQSTVEIKESIKINNILSANKYLLIGHTDSDGDATFNQQLSKKRVDNVYNYLLSKGVDADKISVEYYGESKPLNKNIGEQEKSENRRVEIKFIKDPLMEFLVEKQIFEIDNSKTSSIVGKHGTEITFEANTFNTQNVKIELKEFYNTLDILSANLSTKSGNKLLETSGMIYLEAFSKGKKINAEKDFQIKFTKMNDNEDFELFTGNLEKNLDVDWKLMNNEETSMEVSENVLITNISRRNFSNPLDYSTDGIYTWITNNDKNIKWKNWNQVFDYMNLTVKKNRQCFTNARVKLEIDKNGQFTDVVSSFSDSTLYCDTLFRNSLTDRVVADNLTEKSTLDMTFKMDFGKLDSIEAYNEVADQEYARLALKRIDSINEYNKKNMSMAQQKKLETINEIRKTKIVQYELASIVTYASSLGWINCDRFRQNVAKTDFVVKVSTDMNVRMVSKRFKSFYNGHNDTQNSNQKVFTALPIGEKVTLICTTYKNDEIFVAIENTTISKNTFTDFNFKKVSKDELRKLVSKI